MRLAVGLIALVCACGGKKEQEPAPAAARVSDAAPGPAAEPALPVVEVVGCREGGYVGTLGTGTSWKPQKTVPVPDGISIPRVRMSTPTVGPADFDRQIVRRYLRQQRDKVRSCYTGYLRDHPGEELTIDTGMVIDADGAVVAVTVPKATDRMLAACVQKALKEMKLPPPRGGGVVNLAFEIKLNATGDRISVAALPPGAQPLPGPEIERLRGLVAERAGDVARCLAVLDAPPSFSLDFDVAADGAVSKYQLGEVLGDATRCVADAVGGEPLGPVSRGLRLGCRFEVSSAAGAGTSPAK